MYKQCQPCSLTSEQENVLQNEIRRVGNKAKNYSVKRNYANSDNSAMSHFKEFYKERKQVGRKLKKKKIYWK